jgi:hypothetical protein
VREKLLGFRWVAVVTGGMGGVVIFGDCDGDLAARDCRPEMVLVDYLPSRLCRSRCSKGNRWQTLLFAKLKPLFMEALEAHDNCSCKP